MKDIVKRLIRGEKGKVLIMVLILLVVGGLIVPPLLGLMSTGLMSGRVYETKMHEYYAADAGVEDAIWKIMNDVDDLPNSSCGNQSWSHNYTILGINNRDVDITIEYPGDLTHLITSTGTSDDGSSTTVQAHITLDVEIVEGWDNVEWDEFEDFNEENFDGDGNYYGDVRTEQGILVIDGGTIYGNAWALNGNILLKGGATITGSVKAGGTNGHAVTLDEGSVIEGTVCAQYIELKEGARIEGIAYAECVDSNTIVKLAANAYIGVDAYSENGDVEVLYSGAVIARDAYAAGQVSEENGGVVVRDSYEGYTNWPGCPLGGGSVTITGVGIGSWQIS